MKTQRGKGWVVSLGVYAVCTLVLLIVVAFVTYVNQRVAPQAMSPPAAQAAPVIEPEPAMPDALFDTERMERLLLQPILKGETR